MRAFLGKGDQRVVLVLCDYITVTIGRCFASRDDEKKRRRKSAATVREMNL